LHLEEPDPVSVDLSTHIFSSIVAAERTTASPPDRDTIEKIIFVPVTSPELLHCGIGILMLPHWTSPKLQCVFNEGVHSHHNLCIVTVVVGCTIAIDINCSQPFGKIEKHFLLS